MDAAWINSLNKAQTVIVIAIVAFIAFGLAVGYKMYWNRYDQRPQIVKDQQVFRAQVRTKPDDADAHLNLGWTYYEQGKKPAALHQYKQALSLDKEHIGAMYNIGLVQKDLKNYKEAEVQLKEVLKRAPNHEPASYTLAQVYRESKQYPKAESQYREALKVGPAYANIIAELGLVYEAQGRRAEAVKQYREALRFVPGLKEAQAGLKRLGK